MKAQEVEDQKEEKEHRVDRMQINDLEQNNNYTDYIIHSNSL